MSQWTCYNCNRLFRGEFREGDEIICPECKARIAVLKAEKEYWEAMKKSAETKKTQ
ncbi:MAG TPA: hypothetical protein VJ249_01000 [Candidatus Bathyarchaeia archaeon]|nr:hypothetical protein [Candidatus Bathyarchaeia archaeon]